MADTTTTPARSSKPAPVDGRDPNVRVPAAVRANAERSEALLKAQRGEQPPAEGAPPAAPAAEPTITLQAQPHQQMPTATTVVDAPPAGDPTEKKYSENDLNSMKARFERADKDRQRLSEEVTNLRNVIATMNSAPAPVTSEGTPPELRASSLITDQERTDYGDEFLDVVGRKAKEIAGAEIAELKQQIANLTKGVQATSMVATANARDTMLAHLDENIPDWRNINRDKNFLDWLALPDPFSGAIRQELLNTAYAQNQTARVQAFFQGFLAEEAAVSPANAPPAQPGAAQPSRVPLETFAAPGRAKSAAAPAPVEKPIITRAQISQFYADVAGGKYRGRDAEKAENEAAIFLAEKEGRIR